MRLADRPWLPRPDARVRAALDGAADLGTLIRLAGHGWTEPPMRRLGRKARGLAPTAALTPLRLLVLASSNADMLDDLVTAAGLARGFLIDARTLAYGDPFEALRRAEADVVLLLQDAASLGLGDVADVAPALARLDALAEAVRARGAAPLVATVPGSGAPGDALNHALRRRGHRLFDLAQLSDALGPDDFGAMRARERGDMPFAPTAAPLIATRLVDRLAAGHGRARRVLALDADGTLWRGVLGDDGPAGLVVTPAHRALQAWAKDQASRGALLAIVSRNEEAALRAVLRAHRDMLLREADVVAFAVDHTPKPARLAARLGVASDTIVFVDDDAVERAEARAALPFAAVPELPDDPAARVAVLEAAAFFDAAATPEDALRAASTRARADLAAVSAEDRAAFLASLAMRLEARPFDEAGAARIAQLFARANQFNLTTRRHDPAAVAALAADPTLWTLQGRLVDRVADHGVVALLVAREGRTVWSIEDWAMSCRVLGRGVEEAVLNALAEAARAAGAHALEGRYLPTARNALVADLYPRLGFVRAGEGWRLEFARWAGAATAVAWEGSGPPVSTSC